jgi:hypothetical protein
MAVPILRTTISPSPAAGFLAAQRALDVAKNPCDATQADPWLHQLALSLATSVATLAEFSGLMSQQGFKPETSRLFLDLSYAYRQLAIAHSLGIPRLRTLALELFESCQRLEQRRRQLSEGCRAH